VDGPPRGLPLVASEGTGSVLILGDYSLSCGSCTRELWPPVASLSVGKAVPPARKAPGAAPPTRVGGAFSERIHSRKTKHGATKKSVVPILAFAGSADPPSKRRRKIARHPFVRLSARWLFSQKPALREVGSGRRRRRDRSGARCSSGGVPDQGASSLPAFRPERGRSPNREWWRLFVGRAQIRHRVDGYEQASFACQARKSGIRSTMCSGGDVAGRMGLGTMESLVKDER